MTLTLTLSDNIVCILPMGKMRSSHKLYQLVHYERNFQGNKDFLGGLFGDWDTRRRDVSVSLYLV